MKYTIMGFSQQALLDAGLDTVDALVLRTIKDMYAAAGMEQIIHNNNRYIWINYTYLQAQIPIAGSLRNLMRRIATYADMGLIKRELRHSKNGVRGNFAYVAPTLALDALEDYSPYQQAQAQEQKKQHEEKAATIEEQEEQQQQEEQQESIPLCQNVIRVMTKCHNKDSSIRDTSIGKSLGDDTPFQGSASTATPYSSPNYIPLHNLLSVSDIIATREWPPDVFKAFVYYMSVYYKTFGHRHPRLSHTSLKKVLNTLCKITLPADVIDLTAEEEMSMIDQHFKTRYATCTDYSILHYLSGHIRYFRFMEVVYK